MAVTYSVQESLHVRERGEVMLAPFTMEGHEHNFDHLTILCGGKWHVQQSVRIKDADGNDVRDASGRPTYHVIFDRVVDASCGYKINIPRENAHKFDLVEGRGQYFCIYPSRDPDTHEVVQEYNFWQGAAT